eukprot:TRINITY_DN8838_c0_g1_i3.p1 TRINITY_DN8838_c0_g1~~TRINITY_DN8838_c0_g1_i3.p1  ORF type:complete len:610 (-),score=183.75 TRINITY_DN8838_c0_g1_i3:148-1977(-)
MTTGDGSPSRSPRRDDDPANDPKLKQRLEDFRLRYPVDDRAFDFLIKSPTEVINRVLSDFRAKEEGQDNYSAFLTSFVRKVRERVEHQTGRSYPGDAARERARSEARKRSSDRRGRSSPSPRRRHRRRRKHRKSSNAKKRDSEKKRDSSDYSSSSDGKSGESSRSRSKSRSRSASKSSVYSKASKVSKDGKSNGKKGSDSSRSASSSGSSDDGKAEVDAESEVKKLIAKAFDEEKRAVAEVKERAAKVADDVVEMKITHLEEEMAKKLAEFKQTLEGGKLARIEQIKADVQIDAAEQIKNGELDAKADRERKVQAAQASFQEIVKKRREDKEKKRNNRRLDREIKKLAQKKQRALKEKEHEKKKKTEELAKEKRKKEEAAAKAKREKEKEKEKQTEKEREKDKKKKREKERRRRDSSSNSGERNGKSASESQSRSRRRRDGRDGSRGGGGEVDLHSFRKRYPMDDRAFSCLNSTSQEVQRIVVTRFKPKREGDDDYSALVTGFARAIEAGRAKAQGNANAWRDKREKDGRSRSRSRGGREGSEQRDRPQMEDFRERYPMDDRAFSVLATAPPEVRQVVMADFKPRREGEDDYSALVMGFVRAVRARTGS